MKHFLVVALAALGCGKMLAVSDMEPTRELRPTPVGPEKQDAPDLLIVGLDGVDRDLLEDMLKKGELPGFARLLGGGKDLPHVHFDQTLLSTFPSSTVVAWATIFTGAVPSVHGVLGNEFFIREENRLVAPTPVSFESTSATLSVLTDSYADNELRVPTVYERLRAAEPGIEMWVSMSQFHGGADKLLTFNKDSLLEGMSGWVEANLGGGSRRELYEELDEASISKVIENLDNDKKVPDVLTVYMPGIDQYAHVSSKGPDAGRRLYLAKDTDEFIGKLADKLDERGALKNRWVVIVSDHGHTEVVEDDAHSVFEEPVAVLGKAGFKVRPFKLEVKDGAHSAVVAYQGAAAYVYLADRSRCAKMCDWKRPPRFREDVLAAAEAFHKGNEKGPMRGSLDMVLAREPRPYAEDDLPFQVYVGGGKLVPVEEYLREHPHPTYILFERRLRDLASSGRYGERAGDVLLLLHNGDRATPQERFYFSKPYRSWHGSPSRKDSEVPLIVAHPGHDRAQIARIVRRAIGETPRLQSVSKLLLALRNQ
jgi:predicted AlkP superfamily pyrophosphatase or phosphodiesterase